MTQEVKVINCSSWRKIDILTPSNISNEIVVISTLWSIEDNRGETAIAKQIALNSLEIDFKNLKYGHFQKHSDKKEAIKYHNALVKKVSQ